MAIQVTGDLASELIMLGSPWLDATNWLKY